MPVSSNDALLAQGLTELGIEASEKQRTLWLDYIAAIAKWNKAYNLTAIRDERSMVVKHLLDSLAIASWLPSTSCRLIDVGCGAGLPGVPLAILRADHRWLLLDSNGKKTRFVRQVVAELGLRNVEVEQHRVEDFRPAQPFDALCCRAFSATENIIALSLHVVREGGLFYLMKGAAAVDEVKVLPRGVDLLGVEPITVPNLQEERYLVRLAKAAGTVE